MKYKYEDDKVDYLFSIWEGLIKYSNSSLKTDNNKTSEEVILTLFNILYDSNYEDLNKKGACGGIGEPNFEGVDIGWSRHDAYQITSTVSSTKIKNALKAFEEKKLVEYFPEGLKFLLLNSKKAPKKLKIVGYEKFKPNEQIKTFIDIAHEVKNLKITEENRYNRAVEFLLNQFIGHLPGLFNLKDSEEKIILEVKEAIGRFSQELKDFTYPMHFPDRDRFKGADLLNYRLGMCQPRNPHYPDVQNLIPKIYPILLGFNSGIKKIRTVNKESEKNDLLQLALAHFSQIQINLKTFIACIKTLPPFKDEPVIAITESIVEILGANT